MDAIAFSTDNFSAWNKLGEGGFGPVYKVGGKNTSCNMHVEIGLN